MAELVTCLMAFCLRGSQARCRHQAGAAAHGADSDAGSSAVLQRSGQLILNILPNQKGSLLRNVEQAQGLTAGGQ